MDRAATVRRVAQIGLLAVLRAPDPDGARRAIEAAEAGDIRSGDFAGIREKGRRFVAVIREARATSPGTS
jgi:hypothetical protein